MMKHCNFIILYMISIHYLPSINCKEGLNYDLRSDWTSYTGKYSIAYKNVTLSEMTCGNLLTKSATTSGMVGKIVKVMTPRCRSKYMISANIESPSGVKRVNIIDRCPADLFNDVGKPCNLTHAQCFLGSECKYPKVEELGRGSCTVKDWEIDSPNFCSIGTPKEGCDDEGRIERIAWIVKSNKEKAYVNRLNIEMSQVVSDSRAWFEDVTLPTEASKNPLGDIEYCNKIEKTTKNCISSTSDQCRSLRLYDSNIERLYYRSGTCMEPIYCYGYEDLLVYKKKEDYKMDVCDECKAVCTKSQFILNTNKLGYKIAKFCGRHSCQIIESNSQIITLDRDFYSKISDERISVDVTDKDTFKQVVYSSCPIVDICTAIDCEFCYIRFVNYNCYHWYNWLIIGCLAYTILVLFGLFMITVKPILTLVCFILRILFLTMSKLLRIMYRSATGQARRVRKYAEDDEESNASMKTVNRSLQSLRSNRPSRNVPLVFVVLIILFPLVFAQAPCSNTESYAIDTKVCNKIGEKFNCKLNTIIDLPIYSYDQTSCLHFVDENQESVALLQITPYDLSFSCQKVSEYITRDVEYVSDHIIRCPNSGQCTDDWCNSVDAKTKVEGLSELKWPVEQTCKLGAACWGNGCFYCTSSCHVVRWYARPKNSNIYEVFYCPKWIPAGSFHYRWLKDLESSESTVKLSHGETKTITDGIKLNLNMQVQTKLPVLGRKFIFDGKRTALVEASAKGQPIPGTIGGLQCTTKSRASDLSCVMAPNTCLCDPVEGQDFCDCAQVSLEDVFTQSNTLPLSIGNDHLEMLRDSPILKTAAYGSATIRVETASNVAVLEPEKQECSIEFKSLEGCHSCILGANMSYSCITLRPATIILNCEDKIKLALDCSPELVTRHVRGFFPSPLIDLTCQTSCSKPPTRIYGHLSSIGLRPINNASHIQLAPTESLYGFASWLTSVWDFIGWWYLAAVAILAFLFVVILSCSLRVTSNYISKKMN